MATAAHYETLGLVNMAAESAVLAAMRDDIKAATQLAEILEPSDFADARHAVAFQAIVNLLMGIEPIDTQSIVAECIRVADETGAKVKVPESLIESFSLNGREAVAYGHTVKKLAWLRQAGDFAFWMAQELQGQPKPEQLFVEAQERWQRLQPATTSTKFVYGWDTVGQHDAMIAQRIEEAKQGIVTPYNWPWASWNNIIRPLRSGMLGLLAAPDGMGKTSYLEMIAEHWAKGGAHVVYVHFEDSLDYKLDRRLARFAQIPISAIEDGLLTAAQYAKVKEAQELITAQLPTLHYYDASGESMGAVVRELNTRVSEGVCNAVVLDYLDKVQPTRAQAQLFGGNSWERQGNDVEQLKTFAEQAKVPVFTANQGNKSMQESGTQTRKSIQGSAQKTQKSQLVVILTRDIVGDLGQHDKHGTKIAEAGEYSPVVKVRVDKQNRGKTGSFEQILRGEYFTVRDKG